MGCRVRLSLGIGVSNAAVGLFASAPAAIAPAAIAPRQIEVKSTDVGLFIVSFFQGLA